MNTNALQLSTFGCQHGYMVNVAQRWQTSSMKSLFSHSRMTDHFTAATTTLEKIKIKWEMSIILQSQLCGFAFFRKSRFIIN